MKKNDGRKIFAERNFKTSAIGDDAEKGKDQRIAEATELSRGTKRPRNTKKRQELKTLSTEKSHDAAEALFPMRVSRENGTPRTPERQPERESEPRGTTMKGVINF